MSNNKKPTHIQSGIAMQQALAQQQATLSAQLQSIAAQQPANIFGVNAQLNVAQQQYATSAQLSMQQMQAAMNQMMAQGGIYNQQVPHPWPESKYSLAEIRMALGTKIIADDYKCKLVAVDEVQKLVTIDTGTFMSNKYQVQLWRVEEIPLIDNMYKTKLGRICKS